MGPNGDGKGPGAANLNPKPVDFRNRKWQRSVSDEKIAKAIVYGGPAVGLSSVDGGEPRPRDRNRAWSPRWSNTSESLAASQDHNHPRDCIKMKRREFLKTGAMAVVGTAVAASGIVAKRAPRQEATPKFSTLKPAGGADPAAGRAANFSASQTGRCSLLESRQPTRCGRASRSRGRKDACRRGRAVG